MRGRTKAVALAIMVAGTISAGAPMASATKGDPEHRVTICHATASNTNPYVTITVDVASIVGDSGHGSSGVNEGDIIPAFAIAGSSYPGHNLDLLGAKGCSLPAPPPNDNPPTDSF
jgi:hypothetical protein